jgi:hypothetical protein
MAVPALPVDGVLLVKCLRSTSKSNNRKGFHDCCRFFFPPSAGYDLPAGAPMTRQYWAEGYKSSGAPLTVFDPRQGLVKA